MAEFVCDLNFGLRPHKAQYLSKNDDHFHVFIVLIAQNVIDECSAGISAYNVSNYNQQHLQLQSNIAGIFQTYITKKLIADY